MSIHLDRLAKMDLAIQEDFHRLERLMRSRMLSGAGLRMADALRGFFQEYNVRFGQRGPEWLPASFNVLEAFFPFRKDLWMFDLSEEADYTFSLLDYMDWYTRGGLPEEFRLAADSLREGVAHSYTVLGDAADFLVRGDQIEFMIAGISLIRRGPEIVALLLAGQREPNADPPRDVEPIDFSRLMPGKEGLRPNPELTSEDRLLEGTADFDRVFVATRVNVDQGTHDVRYILIDRGLTFGVLTDDYRLTAIVTDSRRKELDVKMAEGLVKYEPLFSATLSLLYLPVYFGEYSKMIARHEVATMLQAERRKETVRAALRDFGPQIVKFERSISSLSIGGHGQRHARQRIRVPELQFASTGYWKPIGPDKVGEDSDGKMIFGKTWVNEQASWVEVPAERVFAAETRMSGEGADPGYIYVMRAESHASNVYKIGLTRRSVAERAAELSGATAAPTALLELASWAVDNCGAIERAIHRRLADWRINKRREFFRAPLGQIINVIERVMAEEA